MLYSSFKILVRSIHKKRGPYLISPKSGALISSANPKNKKTQMNEIDAISYLEVTLNKQVKNFTMEKRTWININQHTLIGGTAKYMQRTIAFGEW